MKKLLIALALGTAMSTGAHAALYAGAITANGAYVGTTTRNDAWAQENPVSGDEVNFWRFTGFAGQTLTIDIASLSHDFDAAISVYRGVLDSEFELIYPGFDNDGDFAGLTFLGGSAVFGTAGYDNSFSLTLPGAAIYTIAIGGEGFLSFADNYDYRMHIEASPVPVPAAAWLMGSGLLALAGLRRRT